MNITLILTTLIVLIPSSYQLPVIALPLGSFYITLVEMMIFFIFILWGIQALFSRTAKDVRPLFSKYIIIMLCLYVAYIIFGLFQRDALTVLGDFRQYLPLALYFPLLHALHNPNSLEKLRWALFNSLIIISVYIIVVITFFSGPLTAYAVKGNTGFTGERIFIDNSVFLFLSYLGYIIAALFAGSLSGARRMVHLAVIFLSTLVLLIMQVRSFWIMTAIIIIFSYFSFKSAILKFKYISIVTVSTLVLVTIAFLTLQATDYRSKTIDNIKDRFASLSDMDKIGKTGAKRAESVGSIETRLATAEYALEKYIIPNWFFGLGFGAQTPMVNSLGSVGIMKYQIDNGYLTLLLKFGVFGLFFYALFTLKIALSIFRIIFNPQTGQEDVWLAKSFLYAIIAMIAGSFFTSIFIREQVCIVSFVIMLCEIEWMNKRLTINNSAKTENHAR
ncbi:MAG: O-antigen ligase family protein [Pseudomonadota bacterium]